MNGQQDAVKWPAWKAALEQEREEDAVGRERLARVEATVNRTMCHLSRARSELIREANRLRDAGFVTDSLALRAIEEELASSRDNLDKAMVTMGLPG